MVKIETEDGVFTGETMKDANRAARKGERDAAKARAEKGERYKLATLRADSQAFHLMRRKLEGGFHKWEFVPRGHTYCHVQVNDLDTDFPKDVVKFEVHEATGGFVTHRCNYSPAVMGVVCNGAGWTVAVFFKDAAGEIECYAVGANADTYTLVLVPGITIGDFPPRDA